MFIDGEPITSEQGVQQGDPLGPLLYSLTWQKVLKKLPETLALNVWYLDDGHLIGTPEVLKDALSILEREGAEMAIRLNPTKCCLWGPATGLQNLNGMTTWEKIPRTPWNHDSGIKVLGIPVGFPNTHGFAKTILKKAIGDLDEACTVLQSLGDVQCEHLLLRYCLDACKLIHFLRSYNGTALEAEIQQASKLIRDCWAGISGIPDLSNNEWVQSTLPMRLGGMGIKDPTVIAPAARMAASLTFV